MEELMKVRNMPPFAPVLMESTRAMGYSLESALADIVDNSIAAGATKVDIQFSPYGLVPFISILDNGLGMNDDEIDEAMRYGSQSSLNVRNDRDLGRFGLGLKTASLSQCRSLTVISKKDGVANGRRWDLDEVYKRENWALLELEKNDIAGIQQFNNLDQYHSGTLVIWENLDRLFSGSSTPEKLLNVQMDYVRSHLSLVFHRYLTGESGLNKLQLRINNLVLVPLDPFLVGKSTSFQDDESFLIEGQYVRVSAYVLPHISKLNNEEKKSLGGTEGLTKNQGFYVYRNKRLLVWGTWFRMRRKDEFSKLARIRVDIPNSLDHLWTLDIKKSTAVPPDVIKSNLSRIVERISEGSKRRWTFRGKREIGDEGNHLWVKTKVREGVLYNLNRNHVWLNVLMNSVAKDHGNLIENYLKLVENNLPLNQLYIDLNNEESVNLYKENEMEIEILSQANILMNNIKGNADRNSLIGMLLKTDPFCNFSSVEAYLKGEMVKTNE